MTATSVATTKQNSTRQDSLSTSPVLGPLQLNPTPVVADRGGASLFTGSLILEHQGNARALARRARDEFGAFLSRPKWDWFTTHTFKADYVSPKEADKHYFAWLNSLKLTAELRGYYHPFWFRGTEYQDRGTLHFHSLIGGIGDVRRLLFKDYWELHGFARVEQYDPNLGAAHYVGKYLTKTAADIRFSHNLKHELERTAGELAVSGYTGELTRHP